jgi:hypothetical protein
MQYSLARAYLEQAQADFESYTMLKVGKQSTSQWLHCLQMSMEKTGKAYWAAYGSDLEELRKSHLAFGKFIRTLDRNRIVMKFWGFSKHQLRQHLKQLLPVIDSIEHLAPALSHGPNAEYPWRVSDGRILVPCTYPFRNIRSDLESAKGRSILKILEQAIRNPYWHKAFGIAE